MPGAASLRWMHDEIEQAVAATELAAETPVVYERSRALSTRRRGFPWLSLPLAGIAGMVGSGVGSVALGLWYQAQHSSERAAFDALADSFFTYMLCTGALAGVIIRLGLAIFDRSPIIGAATFGAITGLGPGAVAAREFGLQPLPFVGAAGIAIATVPTVLIVAFACARSDARRGGVLAPAACTLAVTALIGGALGGLGGQLDTPPLLDLLRLYLFVGVDRVGAALGAIVGMLVGLAVGLTVRLHRWLVRATETRERDR